MKWFYPRTTTVLLSALMMVPISCEEDGIDDEVLTDNMFETDTENPADDGDTDEGATASEGESVVLAKVVFSDTHQITLAIESDDEFSLTETLNVDLDNAQPSFATLNSEGMSLTEIYDTLAGNQWNETVRQAFTSADEALMDAIQTQRSVDFDHDTVDQAMGIDSLSAVEQFADNTAAQGELTPRASCTTPSWDWQGDDGWFKDNYCFENSVACATSGVGQAWSAYWYGYYTTTWLKSTGFAQAFCNTGRYYFWKKHYGGFPTYGISVSTVKDQILQPRTLYTHARSNSGSYSYKTKMEHYSGNQAARVGLAVHRN